MSAVTNHRISPDEANRLTDKMKSKHYAANGRDVTACGEARLLPSSDEWRATPYRDRGRLMVKEHRFASNRHDPSCKKCRRMLAACKTLDVKALVACGEFTGDDAVRRCEFQVAAAKEMAKRLGPDWKPRVWENLGYHWEVSLGTLKLYPTGGPGYGGPLAAALGYHVIFDGRWCAHAKRPEKCIREAVEAARAEVSARYNHVFDDRFDPFVKGAKR